MVNQDESDPKVYWKHRWEERIPKIKDVYPYRSYGYRNVVSKCIAAYHPKTIMHLGCGPERYDTELKSEGAFLISCDFDKYSLSVARSKGHICVLADAYHLPFKDKSFDFIFAGEIYLHIHGNRIMNVLKESFRVGKLLLFTTYWEPTPQAVYKLHNYWHNYPLLLRQLKATIIDWLPEVNGPKTLACLCSL